MIKLYNTLTRKKEEFKPIEEGKVRFYACGPTVYDFPHIGNFRSFLLADIIYRYLTYRGYQVNFVMNITDIDDKTIKKSEEEGLTLKEFTEKYTKIFFDGLDSMNIKHASLYPRATETVPQMIELIKKLMEKGLAYDRKDAVYYDISKFKDYGKLSRVNLEEMKTGARVDVDEYDKDNPADFALWKKSTPEEIERGICFESPWGKGRPGWHIECSTMSTNNLGETIDIHSGGVDLIFPHHENEIAQSEGATGKKFVNYWVHGEHFLVDGEKMSKSKGNYYTLRNLIDKGFSPAALRFFFLKAHYRTQMNFNLEELKKAEETLKNLWDFMDKLNEWKDGEENTKVDHIIEEAKLNFEKEMDDDLNTPGAIAAIFDFVRKINKLMDKGEISGGNSEKIYDTMIGFDQVLGVLEKEKKELPEWAKELIEKRKRLRKEKKWERADQVRDELKEKGIIVEDTPQGPRYRYI
ncbi:MAG: cysteine--tRNA ligase [Candidatus Aenigmarchaeota archaeon]|nr:cysteine--tRNA ligase [Candidatus Aenigmarchaeota archaeon]